MTSRNYGDESFADELATTNDLVLLPLETDSITAQFEININEIYLTQQPRRYFDTSALQTLVESIKQHGILQPLLVRPIGSGEYELVAGERRYRAAKAAGLNEVPVTVREMSDEQAVQFALIENLQREDINPVEETEGILQLLALRLGQTTSEIISLLHRMQNSAKGKITHNIMGSSAAQAVTTVFDSLSTMSWESFVNNRLPLLNLPQEILKVLRSGKIDYTKAKAIARVKDERSRVLLLEKAITNNWSYSEVQKSIKALNPTPEPIPLQKRFESTYRLAQKSQVWSNPNKKARIEALLAELDSLITSG